MSVSQSCQLVLQSCLKDRRPRERSLPLSLRCFSFFSLSVYFCRLVIPFAKYLKFDIEELVSKVSHNSFTNYFRDLGTFTHLSSEETLPQKDFSVAILATYLLYIYYHYWRPDVLLVESLKRVYFSPKICCRTQTNIDLIHCLKKVHFQHKS